MNARALVSAAWSLSLGLLLCGLPTVAAQPSGTSTEVLPSRSVQVWCLARWEDGSGVSHGSCSPVTVTVGGSEPGPLRVGFYETEVGGSGPQWRAAGWTAVLTAAQLLDYSPLSTQVSFEVRGRIDGPSAGALMTIGTLAAARGDRIREDAAMTGTINPDGMIGPVGGIPHKIEGAAEAGKKLVLIPAGLRYDWNYNKQQNEDLIEVGQRLGVDVRPVLDIYTAYRLMTGGELPRPAAVTPDRLGPHLNALMVHKSGEWQQRAAYAINELQTLPDWTSNFPLRMRRHRLTKAQPGK